MQKTDLLRFKSDTEKLWGIYRGVVEDRDDPLRLGRCRVRVMGVQTEEQGGDLNKVPYDELQWAEPIGPNFEGSISGSGAFCVPLQGSHVMVFYENGNMMQPRYFGSVSGYPIDGDKYSQLDPQDGFRDPDVKYPLEDHIVESDWQRLSKIDKLGETYLLLKEENLDLVVPIAFEGTPWDEQPPMFDAEYPQNNVFATHDDFEENIVIELDATFGKERFAWWHPSKSYMEINFEGRMTFRNTLHRWDICDGMVHMHYMSYHFKTIDDDMVFLMEKSEFREIKSKRWTKIHETDWRNVIGDSHELLDSNEIVVILEDRDTYIGGDDTFQVAGERFVTVAGAHKELTEGDKESVISGDMIKYISGAYEKNVVGDYTMTIEGNNFRSIGANDEKYVVGEIRHSTDEVANHYAADNFIIQSDETVSTYGDTQNIMRSRGECVVQSTESTVEIVAFDNALIGAPNIELIAPTVIIGGTGAAVQAGGVSFTAGPLVMLGVPVTGVAPGGSAHLTTEDPEYIDLTEPAVPPLPADPIDSVDPPEPNIPEEIVLVDVPIEMPEPGCP